MSADPWIAALDEDAGDLGSPRPLVWWGTVLGLMSVGMAMATFLFAYFYLGIVQGDRWPPDDVSAPPVLLPLVVTVLLLAAGVTATLASRAARGQSLLAAQGACLATALLGAGACAAHLIALGQWGVDPTAHAHGSVVTIGLVVHLVVTATGVLAHAVLTVNVGDEPVRRFQAIIALGLLWWFVLLTWVLTAGTMFYGHVVLPGGSP